MCGIAGVLRIHRPGEPVPSHRRAIPDRWLDILDASLAHRGPDGAGRFRDRGARGDGTIVDVALVHRRLSIIDHAGGAQPMVHVRHPDGTGEMVGPGVGPGVASPTAIGPGQEEGAATGPAARTIDAVELPGEDLVALVFNGCVYNHRTLRAALEARGHGFCTDHSDTEVLIHGWRAWGRDVLLHARSMHALLLWDRRRCDLLVARDRFGEKPLYAAADASEPKRMRTIAFASTVPGLIELFGHIDPHAAPHLHRWRTARSIVYGHAEPDTPWDNLWTLPQSTATRVLDAFDSPERVAGDEEALAEPKADDGFADAMAELPLPKKPRSSFRLNAFGRATARRTLDPLDVLLTASVAERLEADVPVACLLSGGVDSSLVASYAKETLGRLTTVCVRMPDARYDESGYAAAVAAHLGTDHVTVDAEGADRSAADDVVRLIETLGLPFGDSSLLPTYWACRAAGEVASVLLTGDGGDEMFVGYDRHMLADRFGDFVGLFLPAAWFIPHTAFPQRDPTSRGARLARLLLAVRRNAYDSLLAIFPAPHAANLLGASAVRPTLFDMPDSGYEAAERDRRHTLPGDYLRKVDTASMAVPIETRAPFLDPRIEAACDRLGRTLTTGGRKGVLRALARRRLPAAVMDRRKQGFAIPIGEWFRTDFGGMRQLLFDHLASADPFPGLAEARIDVDMAYVHRLLTDHDAAGDPSPNPWHGRDHSQRLYALMVLSIWCKWLDRTRRGAAERVTGGAAGAQTLRDASG